jgi:hypothetical protein
MPMAVIRFAACLVVAFGQLLPTIAGDSSKKPVPDLDEARRVAVINAATQAIAKHFKAERNKEKPNEIDARFWGEEISKLKPIRVYNDRVNIAIVLLDKDGVEEGFYVQPVISSYAPQVGERFALMTHWRPTKTHSGRCITTERNPRKSDATFSKR